VRLATFQLSISVNRTRDSAPSLPSPKNIDFGAPAPPTSFLLSTPICG